MKSEELRVKSEELKYGENMEMKKEICEKCRHCLSCMCGDEFEDCHIKNPNLKRTITHIVIKRDEQ